MSKKHFIALADVVRFIEQEFELKKSRFDSEHRVSVDGLPVRTAAEIVRYALADFCKRQNGAFMRNRWIDYIDGKCGPNGGRI